MLRKIKWSSEILKTINILTFFVPILAAFLPMDQFLVIGTTTVFFMTLNVKQFLRAFVYRGNYIFYIFVLYMGILAYINNNLLGMIAVFFLLLITIYISILRTLITKRIFEVLMIIVALGSIFSLYYCTVNFYTTSTYLLYKYFMDIIPIGFEFVLEFAEGIRTASTFIQPNYYGHLSAFIALVSLFYILSSLKEIYHKHWGYVLKLLFYCLILSVNLYALNLSQSRSAYFGLVFGVLVLVLFFDPRIFVGLSIPLVIFILTKYNDFLALFPRLDSAFQDGKYRISLYKAALEAIKDHWVIGKGFYTFPLIWKDYFNQYEIHTHNIFLELMLDSGLVGMTMLLAYFTTYIKRPIKAWAHRNREYLPLVFGILALEVVNGMTDAVLIFPQSFILLSIVLLSLELHDEDHGITKETI